MRFDSVQDYSILFFSSLLTTAVTFLLTGSLRSATHFRQAGPLRAAVWVPFFTATDNLFPGREPTRPITPSGVRWGLRKAVAEAGLTKRITPHSLRHGFATHLLELGEDIRTIQRLLGHASIQTTARYTKVTGKHLGRTKSPLDLLGTQQAKVLG